MFHGKLSFWLQWPPRAPTSLRKTLYSFSNPLCFSLNNIFDLRPFFGQIHNHKHTSFILTNLNIYYIFFNLPLNFHFACLLHLLDSFYKVGKKFEIRNFNLYFECCYLTEWSNIIKSSIKIYLTLYINSKDAKKISIQT